MKNLINYYYNFNTYNIRYSDNKYNFKNGEKNYILKPYYEKEITDYNYLNFQLNLLGDKYFFKVVPNRNKSYITLIDDRPYILLKISNINNETISIYDLKTNLYINNPENLFSINRSDWITLWTSKIDYFEKWLYEKKEKYHELYELVNFYIGLSENALLYLKENSNSRKKNEYDNLCIQHKRINKKSSLYEYYDVTEVILDHPSRDISEYIKSCMIEDDLSVDDIKEYISKHNYSAYGIMLIYVRILFPTFFYDYIDDIMLNNKEKGNKQLEIITMNYYKNLRRISSFFKNEYNIPIISWIIKNE